jgi:protein-S-isoprenylcysteine O-methyltransferase
MFHNAFEALWALFAAVWLVAAFTSKRTAERETPGRRAVHVAFLAVASLLLFQPWRLGPLNVRFVPDTPAAALGGFVLAAAGIGFAFWARLTLGRNWSGTVTIKEDHRLICRGPYRIVRHPIYTGVLLAMLGTAIGSGTIPCLLGALIAAIGFWTKLQTEEQFMTRQFGLQYTQYRKQVKALVPGLL